MLTQTLRSLERDGLVSRTVYATAPPSVGYALTTLGASAVRLLDDTRQWSETHVLEVMASRETYDKRSDAAESRRALSPAVAGMRKHATGATARR
jgi:DNA-binding HxlR family transcriptional regulator